MKRTFLTTVGCLLLYFCSAQTSESYFSISRFQTNELGGISFSAPEKLESFELLLLTVDELDTLAQFVGNFSRLPNDSVRGIRFSEDYFLVERNNSIFPGIYQYTFIQDLNQKGYWSLRITNTRGESYSYRKSGPLFWERMKLPNSSALPTVSGTYQGRITAGIEYGAASFPGNEAPLWQSYTNGELRLELTNIPMVVNYQVHSAHSDQRPLNYLQMQLDNEAIKRKLKEEKLKEYQKQIDSFSLKEEIARRGMEQLTQLKTEAENGQGELRDSLTALKRNYEDSLQNGYNAALDSQQALVRAQELRESMERKTKQIEERQREIQQKLTELESRIQSAEAKVDSVASLKNRLNEYLLHRPEDYLQASSELPQADPSLLQKLLPHINDLKIGRHALYAGKLAGTATIKGASVAYRKNKNTLSASYGNTVLPVNDSFLTPTLYIKRNASVGFAHRTQSLETGLITYLGRGNIADEVPMSKPLATFFLNFNQSRFSAEAELSSGLELLGNRPAFANSIQQNRLPLASLIKLSSSFWNNKLSLDWEQRSIDKAYKGIGYFQGYRGFEEYKGGLSFVLLSGRFSGSTFLQLFEDENNAYAPKRSQLGLDLRLSPFSFWTLNYSYLPNRTGFRWMDRSAQLQQNFSSANSSLNFQLGTVNLSQQTGYQLFETVMEKRAVNKSLILSQSISFDFPVSIHHSYTSNFSDEAAQSFYAHQFSLSLPRLAKGTSLQLGYLYQNGSKERVERVFTSAQSNISNWLIDLRIDYSFRSLHESTPPIYCKVSIGKSFNSKKTI